MKGHLDDQSDQYKNINVERIIKRELIVARDSVHTGDDIESH
jgi:hypothetical protein